MELLHYKFFINALLAGTLLAILTAILSFFIVLKRYSYYSVGISHISFGGVALGLLLGYNPILVSLAFTVLIAFGIAHISKNRDISEDSAIGIFFSFSMALGVILISLIKNYTTSALSYLFGDILTISDGDIWVIFLLSLIIIATIVFLFKYFLLFIFDPEFAITLNIPVTGFHYLLLIMMAIAIVISIKAIGIVLVSALLVIPANTALLATKNYKKMLWLTILFSLLSVYLGIFFSYKFNLPSGASIVVVNTLFFLFFYLLRQWKIRKTREEGSG